MNEHVPQSVTGGLGERLRSLEETQRATLNLLEDFDIEKSKLTEFQQATMNLLEDFDQERQKAQQVQRAALNLLEDFDAERQKFQEIQKATLNLLEDMNEERLRLRETQRAVLNMLEDIEGERAHTQQAMQQLEVANKELEAFSYSVSHDLRAPLRAISGFVDALVEDCADQLDSEGKRYLGLIQSNAHDMGQLIDDLLAFSRLGRQPINRARIDLPAMARGVFQELMALASERQGHVSLRITTDRMGEGDPTLIRQVLINLISNAIKFSRTKTHGSVEFGWTAQPAEAGIARGPAIAGGAYYVRDNGVGFDMRYADKLFGVFQRLHAVTEFEGTGVGLALVSRIITRHGGRVWAHSEIDRGATFFFSLPGGSP